MYLLDEYEIKKIENRVETADISNRSLSVDLIDHICCMIEERIDSGKSLEVAENEAFSELGEVQLKAIDIETTLLTQNKFIMKKHTKIIGIVSLVLIITGFIFKFNHLAGAGAIWGVGILTAAFGFFLMVLVDRFSYEKNRSKRLIVFVGYLGSAFLLLGIGLALLRWYPISTYLAEGGGVLLLVYFILTNSNTVGYEEDK